MSDFAPLTSCCAEWGIALPEDALRLFEQYRDLLLDWNQRVNLTAITEPHAVVVKHFTDSLTLLAAAEIGQGARLLDVGSGAGFPAIPLLIARRDLQITMLDSLNKRLLFLQEVLRSLSLQGKTLHLRAEEGARQPQLREQFDFVTARAVASLPVLAEYCIPYVKPGGLFAAMKGPEGLQEAQTAERAISLLGAAYDRCVSFQLPDGSRRTILLYKKMSPSPTKYPRISAKIAKNPL